MFKLFTIKRESAIATVGGIVGALAAIGVDEFRQGVFGETLPQLIGKSVGLAIFFIVLLLGADLLFKKIDDRTIKPSKKSKK